MGYGIVSRILKAVTAEARADGLKVGLLRPVSLYPFPKARIAQVAERAKLFIVVELSHGQMIEDVELALRGARPVEFLSRVGGNVPTHEDVLQFVRQIAGREGLTQGPIAPARESREREALEKERMAHV